MIKSLEERELILKNNIKTEIEILSKKFKKISALFSKLSKYFIQNKLDKEVNKDDNVIHLNDGLSNNNSIDNNSIIEILNSDSSEKVIQRKRRRKINKPHKIKKKEIKVKGRKRRNKIQKKKDNEK